jgi:DNA-binding NarL/FixJ family response regulator
MSKKIRVTCIEDHKVVREGVNYLLSLYDFLEVIDKDFEYDKTEEFIKENEIDVVILDLQLQTRGEKGEINGFDLCELITKKFPDVNVVAHSMYDDVESVNKLFRMGGMGFVSKKAGHAELISAIRQVTERKKYICKEMYKKVKNAPRFLRGEDEQLKPVSETFTRAEKSILEKIAKGYSTKQIAQQLEISEKTVETHRKHLFVKAKVKNVAELIAFAYSRRIFID